MPYSAGTTDPFGYYVLAWIPVALALVGAAIALFPAIAVLILDFLSRHRRTQTHERKPDVTKPEPAI